MLIHNYMLSQATREIREQLEITPQFNQSATAALQELRHHTATSNILQVHIIENK